ncbi:MAG TPA: hypothetical protein ENF90_00915 [Candidatus Bathyarchaeota archaeon]|nr:hypothetical protein [Candidatus Bathyarchaeota archaeon]
MRIKEVRVEKLFSLEKYNNERFGFVAELAETDNPDKVFAELYQKILSIEDFLDAYRRVNDNIETVDRYITNTQHGITRIQTEIAELKVSIDELARLAEKGDPDARLRHACDRRSLKSLNEDLERKKKELAHYIKVKKQLTEIKETLKKRFNSGNFSLEGIEFPEKIVPVEEWF